jgi:hypothetical protein
VSRAEDEAFFFEFDGVGFRQIVVLTKNLASILTRFEYVKVT